MTCELLALGFDARCQRLILAQYAMPRRVRVGKCLTEQLLPQRSALAGCGWANTMAKGVTVGLLEIWYNQLPMRPTMRAEQYVDDIVVSVRGSAYHVAEHAVPQALLLRDLLAKAGFTLAKK